MDSGYLVYNNRMWIFGGGAACTKIGGAKSDVWSSANGVTWTCATTTAPFGRRWSGEAVVFQNKMWYIGGAVVDSTFQNDVWSSTDGVNWTQVLAAAPWTARENFGCVVFNNQIWVICGDDTNGLGALSDVWSSPDGVNWTQMGNFPSARTGPACVVFNGALWVIAGGWAEQDPSDSNDTLVEDFNDAWYSTDGANWTQATANAGFTGRVYPAAQVYNNQIWLIGGVDTSYLLATSQSGIYGDAWVSNDGAHWSEVCSTLPFSARFSAESYVFNNALWMVGGCSADGNDAVYNSDAWHHP